MGGTIAGTVTYVSDPNRPWRYRRNYIANLDKGELAEAVVCLSHRSLKKSPPPEQPRTVTIDQANYQFTPETVAIRAGERVRFTNSDASPHNVMALNGDERLNVTLTRDDEHTQTFRRAGNAKNPVRIGCSFHSQMQAWIFVFDHPFFAVTGADGKFRWENVPPGEYTLELVHPAGNLSWSQPVVVAAGQTQTVVIRTSPNHLNKPSS